MVANKLSEVIFW